MSIISLKHSHRPALGYTQQTDKMSGESGALHDRGYAVVSLPAGAAAGWARRNAEAADKDASEKGGREAGPATFSTGTRTWRDSPGESPARHAEHRAFGERKSE